MNRKPLSGNDSGPWAIVTGGSRGIGRGVCLELARRGWNVGLWYLRDDSSAAEVEALIQKHGGTAVAARVNVGRADEVTNAMEALLERTDVISGLVHCAGLGALAPTLGARPNRWSLAWDIHVGGLLTLVDSVRDRCSHPASVVAVSSLGAWQVTPGYAAIASAKASLESLVRYLAVDLAEQDIRVNAVRAGPVDTDSLRSFPWYEQAVRSSASSPAARIGAPVDIARVIAFLLGEDSVWIRGQVIVADGGLGLV